MSCPSGLPPLFHGDDPLRAVCAARDLIEFSKVAGLEAPRIGIATGTVFCGLIGGETRREFTVSAAETTFHETHKIKTPWASGHGHHGQLGCPADVPSRDGPSVR